jgi:hypothetical protein
MQHYVGLDVSVKETSVVASISKGRLPLEPLDHDDGSLIASSSDAQEHIERILIKDGHTPDFVQAALKKFATAHEPSASVTITCSVVTALEPRLDEGAEASDGFSFRVCLHFKKGLLVSVCPKTY